MNINNNILLLKIIIKNAYKYQYWLILYNLDNKY